MKIYGVVVFKCENVVILDLIIFEISEFFIFLFKWNVKKIGLILFDFRITELNGFILFSYGKLRYQKDVKYLQMIKVDFFVIEMLDGYLYFFLDMGLGIIKIKVLQKKVNDGEWYYVDF